MWAVRTRPLENDGPLVALLHQHIINVVGVAGHESPATHRPAVHPQHVGVVLVKHRLDLKVVPHQV